MSENELVEFIMQERINKALVNVQRTNRNTNEEKKKILKAERIIDNLPKSKRKFIEFYLNDLIHGMALQEVQLYKTGFTDGVKTINMLKDL